MTQRSYSKENKLVSMIVAMVTPPCMYVLVREISTLEYPKYAMIIHRHKDLIPEQPSSKSTLIALIDFIPQRLTETVFSAGAKAAADPARRVAMASFMVTVLSLLI